jgi:NADPH:quinone reductase
LAQQPRQTLVRPWRWFGTAPREVLIGVKLALALHADPYLTRSQPSIPKDLGYFRRGSEAVGIVRALGSEVEGQGKVKVADRAAGFPDVGFWRERVAIPAAASPIPVEPRDKVAARLLISYVTACILLRGLRKSVVDEVHCEGAMLVTEASTVVARQLLYFLYKEGLAPISVPRDTVSAKRVTTELMDVQVAVIEDTDWQTQATSLTAWKKILDVLDCVSGSLIEVLVPPNSPMTNGPSLGQAT